MKYMITATYPVDIKVKYMPTDPAYEFNSEIEAQVEANRLQNEDTEGIIFGVAPME